MNLYCGNNRRHSTLRDGTARIGTRYECLKKGIGVGINLPYDPEFHRRFVPIDARKIWCGVDDELPASYSILGSRGMCFTKGVGMGKKIKAKRVRN